MFSSHQTLLLCYYAIWLTIYVHLPSYITCAMHFFRIKLKHSYYLICTQLHHETHYISHRFLDWIECVNSSVKSIASKKVSLVIWNFFCLFILFKTLHNLHNIKDVCANNPHNIQTFSEPENIETNTTWKLTCNKSNKITQFCYMAPNYEDKT